MTTSSPLDKAIDCGNAVLEKFKLTGTEVPNTPGKRFPFQDYEFESLRYRKAHLSIVDAREQNKLWFMHCCVFPHTNDSSPIFGFDIICGPSRVSGAFLDFSNAGNSNHYMMRDFEKRVVELNWKKERDLPDWAKSIFSPAMVAIGSVADDELDKFIALGLESLDYYLGNVGITQESLSDFHMAQNFYCRQQKMNPHTPRVMASLGLDPDQVREFSHQVLFPEIIA
jgi:hypothetical protein